MADDSVANVQTLNAADNSASLNDMPSDNQCESANSGEHPEEFTPSNEDLPSELPDGDQSNAANDLVDDSPESAKTLSKEEKLQRAYEIQTRRRLERQQKEKQEEIERERNRIIQQRAMQENLTKLEENSRQNAIKQIKREKEEHEKERRRQEELLKLDWKERFGTNYEEKVAVGGSESDGQPVGLKGRQLVAFWCNKLLADNKSADRAALRKCVTTLKLYIGNILASPSEMKYRKIKRANQTFSNCVIPFVGAVDLLYSVGFDETDDGFLVLNKTPDLFLMENAVRYLDVQIERLKH